MKKYQFIINEEKNVLFIGDKKNIPQYNKKWGVDRRIACTTTGFKFSRSFLADNILSKNANDRSQYNVRFVVFYNKANMVTENTTSLKNLLNSLNGDDFVILPVKANRRHLIPVRDEAQEYAMKTLQNILRLAFKKVA